jgi:hypothetical protein
MIGPLKSGRGNRTHPDKCVGCGVPLLTRKRFAAPPEGYEWHQGHGKCGKCYSQARSRPRPQTVLNCTDCGRPFRLQHETIAERPGTMIHAGRGLCKNHYEIRRKNGTLPPRADGGYATAPPAEDPEADARKVEHTRREIVAYIRARRARGWPADGTLPLIEGL